jgi:D-amino-acid dehydrogenase
MTESADVAVIGGGAVGLSVATFAARGGARVLLVERDGIGRGCSYANAGLIVPSFSLPLARPGTLWDLPNLLSGKDKMVGFRPRPDAGLMRWILRFLLSSRRRKMINTASQLGRLGRASLEILKEWAAMGGLASFRQEGWLHLYETDRGFAAGERDAALLRELGMTANTLGRKQILSLEPGLKGDYAGGVFYPEEAHIEPFELSRWLLAQARDVGVRLLEGTEVRDLEVGDGRVSRLDVPADGIHADQYVLAAGAWSGELMKPHLGWLPVEPAKGHSLTYRLPASKPSRPLKFAERHIVVIPFSESLRLTTGLDLVGFDDGIDGDQIARLRGAAAPWGPELEQGDAEEWCGFRPMTPDGLPIVGRTRHLKNLWLATGHGQLGITMAPITGRIIAAQLAGEDPPVDIGGISPARFGL